MCYVDISTSNYITQSLDYSAFYVLKYTYVKKKTNLNLYGRNVLDLHMNVLNMYNGFFF